MATMSTYLLRVLAFLVFLSYSLLLIAEKFNWKLCVGRELDRVQNQKLRDKIDEIKKLNSEMQTQLLFLNQSLSDENLTITNNEMAPPENYELIRRRIYTNVQEIQNLINYELDELAYDDLLIDLKNVQEMVNEQCLALLTDIYNLTNFDNYSPWRRKQSENLRDLVQTRLGRLQNPSDCKTARKLVCNLSGYCGYTCRLHFLLNCFVLAYITERTLILNDTAGNWNFTKNGWDTLYLPLSDTCNYSSAGLTSAPAEQWPGRKDARVLSVDILHFITETNPYYPFEIPEDLAPSLRVLHGDPVAWWVGQFMTYMCRPQPFTQKMFDEYAKKVNFQTPIVGVHIRRTDKKLEYDWHIVEEYMYHVEEYYKMQELGGDRAKRRIYLASEGTKIFAEVKKKYPEYEVIGDENMAKIEKNEGRDSDHSIYNIVTDVHFLSRCDYVVCTFSSNVCRMVYEMKSVFYANVSAMFKSLDLFYNYSGEIRRLYVCVLPNVSNRHGEIELEIGDPILLKDNLWNGFSIGLNLRTEVVGSFPTFKVTPKIETSNFVDYPKTEIEIQNRKRVLLLSYY